MCRRALTALLGGAALLGIAAPAEATYPGDNGRIVYENFASSQIESINPDGTDHLVLSHVNSRKSFASAARVSADGQTIFFEKHKPTPANDLSAIWKMDIDGDNPEKVAGHGKLRYYNPQPSPSGSRIVFTRCKPGDGVCAIWDMAGDGSDERALTPYVHDLTNEAVDFHPVYSPDGSTIVFDRFFSDGEISRLFTMDSDGDDEQPLTPPELEAFGSDWAPDGSVIAFSTASTKTGSNIFSIEPDGDNPLELAADPYPDNNIFPAYSPEGDQIVFTGVRDGSCCSLYLMPAAGGTSTKIPHTPGGGFDPAWAPAIP